MDSEDRWPPLDWADVRPDLLFDSGNPATEFRLFDPYLDSVFFDETDNFQHTASPDIKPLHHSLCYGIDAQGRLQAAWKLGLVKPQNAIHSLITALQDADIRVRTEAVRSLGRTGDARAIEPLAALLRQNGNPGNQELYKLTMAAAWALAEFGQAAVPALIQVLRVGTEYTQMLAATALKEIGQPAVDALIYEFPSAPVELQHKLIWVLWSIGDARAVPTLIEATQSTDAKVRRYAAWALGQMGDSQAIPALIAALDDSDSKVRWDAGRAIEQFGGAAVELLVDVLYRGGMQMREAAANALAWIRDTRAIDALTRLLYDREPSVRVRAAFALGWIRDSLAVDPLVQALGDRDDEVRLQVILALGWICDKRAVEPLLALMDDDNVWVTYTAIEALGNIGDQRAAGALRQALESPNPSIQAAARDALKKLDVESLRPGQD